jgi:hypothetical protein
MTRLSIQIRAAFTLTIAHEQGEAQNAANGGPDGVQLTQASTTTPYDFWWKGELWHIASAAQSTWTLLIIGEADDSEVNSSQRKLDYSVRNPRCQ